MKIQRLVMTSGFVLAFFTPVIIGGSASASAGLECFNRQLSNNIVDNIDQQPICDLTITKEVSVNGGEFVDADTSDAAALAQVGDTITWKITVSNNSSGSLTPAGTVVVHDALPSQVSLNTDGAVASTGSFSDNDWTFVLTNSDGFSHLPVTLTLTTTASSQGLIENSATLADYTCPGEECVDPPYVDAINTNNTNVAFVNIQTKPQVLGESTSTPQVLAATTLANTGSSSIAPSILSGLMIAATLALGYLTRRSYRYSVKR